MGLLSVLSGGVSCGAEASAQTCSVADIRGTYLYQSVGMHSATDSSNQVPAHALGLVRFDGSGQATGRMTITIGSATSTYDFSEFRIELNPDCTGRAQYLLKSDGKVDLGPDKHEILVLDEGARIWAQVAESPGRTVLMTAELKRVGRGSYACAQSMIRGTYLMHYDGWINQQILNPRAASVFVPAIGNALLVVDPETGTAAGSGTHNFGGTIFKTVLKSEGFRVNPDCTGTFDIKMGGMSGTPPIVATENGDRIIVLQTALPAFQYYERISIP